MNAKIKIGVAIALLGCHLFILFPGFFAPYNPIEQNRDFPYRPPELPRLRDAAGNWHVRPFIYAATGDDAGTPARQAAVPIHFFVSGARYQIAGSLHSRYHLFGTENGARVFLLGTDELGRDQLSRLLYGARISLFAGILATALSLAIGLAVGTFAGYYGGVAGAAVVRVADFFIALPWIYLLLAVRAFLPLRLGAGWSFAVIVIVLGFIGWARQARIVRSVVLAARERGFVRAARGFGASDFYLLRRHVVPQTFGVLLTQATILIPQYVIAETTLSFFGLGMSEPHASIGNLLSALQHYDVLVSYWWMYVPAVVLVPLCLGYSAVASAVHDRFGKAYL
ncbi:MAG TPA: ABC transporter permease [Candidatus Acidoferrales bacterium]|nr:ABC transporter permease [Candidatus Acidoferrales bacterium]